MGLIQVSPDTEEKLSILSRDSQYDLACACGSSPGDKRRRSKEDTWVYPVALPNRPKTFLFKTLISNVCGNDCGYCPLRAEQDPQRVTMSAEETVNVFFDYFRKKRVQGLFLSSGMFGSPDITMERLNTIARRVRNRGFRGYLHLKIIPGASDAAIEDSLSLASVVSLNIETAGEEHFRRLSGCKKYLEDIIRPIKLISGLTGKGNKYQTRQTTQFVVGAAEEKDNEIVKYMWGLYKRLGLSRIFFSAYQRGMGREDLPGETSGTVNSDLLTREHRLYQTDFLIRKYGFEENEICYTPEGNLDLVHDPKQEYADRHPALFPVDINKAEKKELLKVPGLGPTTVNRVIKARKNGVKFRRIEDVGKPGKLLKKADLYLKYGW